MIMKRIIIGLIVLCLIVFLFLVWPRQVNFNMKGIEYTQLNKSTAENITIKINGQINNRFFGVRKFTGRIYCEALDLDGEYFNLLFDDSNKSYLSIIKESGETVNYGEIFSNKNMNELVIVSGDDILVFPSKNREIAEKISNKYFLIEYDNHFKTIQ